MFCCKSGKTIFPSLRFPNSVVLSLAFTNRRVPKWLPEIENNLGFTTRIIGQSAQSELPIHCAPRPVQRTGNEDRRVHQSLLPTFTFSRQHRQSVKDWISCLVTSGHHCCKPADYELLLSYVPHVTPLSYRCTLFYLLLNVKERFLNPLHLISIVANILEYILMNSF